VEGIAMPKILQVNYKLNGSVAGFMREAGAVASALASVPGLRWKVWLMNETEHEGGGIYLFDNDASLQAFLEGPIVTALKDHPALTHLSVKQFDVSEDLTKETRGHI
jgi:hypothetical protein